MQDRKKKAPEGMYTAQEAIAIIGVSPATFYLWVNAGKIRRFVPPGRKEGYYSKKEIDQLALKYNAAMQGELTFGLALPSDLPGIHEMVAAVSGGLSHAVPVETLDAWIRMNGESVHVLRKGAEIWGYIAAFPLEKETLYKRLAGEYLNRQIPPAAIQQFPPHATIALYVAEIAVKDPENHYLGRRLLRESARFFVDLERQQGTVIGELYAVATSPLGIAFCNNLGMQPMDLPAGVREDRQPFYLNLEMARSQFIRGLLSGRGA